MTKFTFIDRAGNPIEAKGFIERLTLEIDGDAIENPIHESHKRGHNWAARMDGKNAAVPDRNYMPVKGAIIDVTEFKVGSAVAIAGDYTSSGGNFSPNRIWGVVIERTEDTLVLDRYATEAKAMSARNKGIRAIPVEAAEDTQAAA